MKAYPRIQFSAKLLLLVTLLAINEFPFWTSARTSYEVICFSLAAIHAELCLMVIWLLYFHEVRRWTRLFWSSVIYLAAWIAATGLLAGSGRLHEGWRVLGLLSTLPAAGFCSAILATAKWFTSTHVRINSQSNIRARQFPLRHLVAVVAIAAYLSLLGRQFLMNERTGWYSFVESHLLDLSWLCVHSAGMGLLIAPCALFILKPTRWSLLWVPYYLVFCAIEPIVAQWVWGGYRIAGSEWLWPDSYVSVVTDNITWYAPQLLPTVFLLVTFRLTGVRVEKKK